MGAHRRVRRRGAGLALGARSRRWSPRWLGYSTGSRPRETAERPRGSTGLRKQADGPSVPSAILGGPPVGWDPGARPCEVSRFLGPSATLRGPGRLGGTRELHKGGPVGVVNQRAERDSPAGQQAIPLVSLLSGFAGPTCEVVWARQLVLGFGHTAEAISAILVGDWCCCGRHAPSA